MRTAVDLINLSLLVPLDYDIPERVWSGKDVSYSHLNVFDCRAFIHIPRNERSKLDDKARQCIFLGYGHEEYRCRLWDPIEKKLIRSRDVVFFEDQTIQEIMQPVKSRTLTEIPVKVDPVIPPMGTEEIRNDE